MFRFALTALLCLVSAGFASAADRPNIILILADDLGRDWIGCYGGAGKTPHVDKLAAQGVRFRLAWSAPICTPTRVEMLTGLYPFRTGWTDHHDVPRWGGAGLQPERHVAFPRLLRESGYATAIGGKWQINDLRKGDILKAHGFDEHCVWPGAEAGNPPSNERYWGAYLQTNGKREVHKDRFGPDVVNTFLCDFIRRHKDGPFFAYYPMMLTHGPMVPTPTNRADPPKGNKALYADMVQYADALVGKVVQTVDELGIADHTVIVFAGDNGSPLAGGHVGDVAFPAGKGQITDRGMHVPFVVRGIGEAGRVTDAVTDFTDIFPTLVDLAGAKPPQGVKLDGGSLVPVLRGGKGERTWIFAQRGAKRTVCDGRYKLDSSGAFYYLQEDPLEKEDLSGDRDQTAAPARERLAAVLRQQPADAPSPFAGYRPAAGKAKGGR